MIEYKFKLKDGSEKTFAIDLDRPANALNPHRAPASWCELGYHKCKICPLDSSQHPYCPTALDIEGIAAQFYDMYSYDKLVVVVNTENRSYVKDCDAQTGLRGLLGLVMATSACPIISQLKGLAYFHLPFANVEESLFRSASAYLIKQYFIAKDGGQPDMSMKGLTRLYQELQLVNESLKSRLSAASTKDANLNAVCALAFLSLVVAYSLEDEMEKLRDRFCTPSY